MCIKNTELLSDEFNKLDINTVDYKIKECYLDIINFDKFRNFIFSRYNIKNLDYDCNYPEVILVKRGDRISLIDDTYLSKINLNITTGKERREINDIALLDEYLKIKYKNNFKSLYFENINFEEQVKYFNNAKLIIAVHGAVLSNMMFCKEDATIVEITCGIEWDFFKSTAEILKLNYVRCNENNFDSIINIIKEY